MDSFAFSLGWMPARDGCFAWNNDAGDRMVESYFWQSGNINIYTREHYETGEGWIIVASRVALDTIKEKKNMYIHKNVLRRYANNPMDMSHGTYKIEEMG